jgi:hypothetical protein
MLWFKYRWILTFSHGLCVKILRGGARIRVISEHIRPMSPTNAKNSQEILGGLMQWINILDDIIFSVSALMYRLEKDLIEFNERAEDAAKRMIERLKREGKRYNKDIKKLERLKGELERKRRQLPRLQKNIEHEQAEMEKDKKKKNDYLTLLHELTNFIEDLDHEIHYMHLEAKAQRRGTLNTIRLREHVIMRSDYWLSELIGRKGGIESDALLKVIHENLKQFDRIVKKEKRININQVKELLKHCRLEEKDLRKVFLYILQEAERVSEKLKQVETAIGKDGKLKPIVKQYFDVKKRLNVLRSDIQKQNRRLDNEFKKGGFMPTAQIQKEMKRAA